MMKMLKNTFVVASLSLLSPFSIWAGSNPASIDYVDNAVLSAAPIAGNGLLKTGNELSLTPYYQIGDLAQDGIVFFLDNTGRHGLVAALTDSINSPLPWWPVSGGGVTVGSPVLTGGYQYGLGNGYVSTILTLAAVARQTTAGLPVFAAEDALAVSASTDEPTCDNKSCVGGWYLPNQTEIALAIQNLCGITATGFVPFQANTTYWTSKQQSTVATSAVSVTTDTTACGYVAKFASTSSVYAVRPIRQF